MEKRTVTEKALIGRINRKLKRENKFQQLHKTRMGQWYSDLGPYHIVDHSTNSLTHAHIDIEDLGREMKTIGPDEKVTYPENV